MRVMIYHNRRCSTSRGVLALIREAGIEPVIIDYLQAPPSPQEMLAVLLALDMTPRAMLRKRAKAYASLGLGNEMLTDRQLLDAMLDHPAVIECPIVISDKGARLCRPPETVLELL